MPQMHPLQFLRHKQLYVRTALTATAAVMLSVTASPLLANAAAAAGGTNNDTTVTSSEVRSALQKTDNTLDSSAQTQVLSDNGDSLKAASAGATLSVPKDAKKGVTLENIGVAVSLPNANNAKTGKTVANGVVAYEGTNGSANAIQANTDGSVRMLTVIDNPNAPTTYDYNLSLPQGASLRLNADGSVVITSGKDTLAQIDKPWAKDATGKTIQTYYTVSGSTLTQHILHKVKGVKYPVTADPVYRKWWGWQINLNKRQTVTLAAGYSLAGILSGYIPNPIAKAVGSVGFGAAATYAGWVASVGACLQVNVTYSGGYWLNHYYGGDCR